MLFSLIRTSYFHLELTISTFLVISQKSSLPSSAYEPLSKKRMYFKRASTKMTFKLINP